MLLLVGGLPPHYLWAGPLFTTSAWPLIDERSPCRLVPIMSAASLRSKLGGGAHSATHCASSQTTACTSSCASRDFTHKILLALNAAGCKQERQGVAYT